MGGKEIGERGLAQAWKKPFCFRGKRIKRGWKKGCNICGKKASGTVGNRSRP